MYSLIKESDISKLMISIKAAISSYLKLEMIECKCKEL